MHASVVAQVDNASQRMTVVVDGVPTYSWPVSTARSGYQTPAGSYSVKRMERMWYSRKYDMSPMPHALFFRGGYAIHGTYSIRQLGRPASHGCVRLSPSNARTLFSLAQQHGGARVVVTGGNGPAYASLKRVQRPRAPVSSVRRDPFWEAPSAPYEVLGPRRRPLMAPADPWSEQPGLD